MVESLKTDYNVSISIGSNFANATPKQRISEVEGKFIIDADHTNDDIKEHSPKLYNLFKTKVSNENEKEGVNGYKEHTSAYYFYDGGFTKRLNELMKDASDREKEVAERIDKEKQNALMKKLGFKPTVENMTKIMMAHFETFAHMIHKTAIMIENQDPKRDTATIGLTDDDDIADVPDRYRSETNGCLIVPPFPKVTKIVHKNGTKNREESWVGDYGNMFKETDLVHGILNGIDEFVQTVSAGDTTGGAGSTSTIKTVMNHPLSPLDFILTNSVYEDFSQNETSSLLSLVGLRALQIIGTTNFKNWSDKCEVLGAAEAENLISAEKIGNDDFLKKLTALTASEIIEMLKGNETAGIKKPSTNMWPWQENTGSTVGLITSNGEFNICKVKSTKGNDIYTLPIQSLNWKTIKREVLHTYSSTKSDNYFNISLETMTNDYKDNIFNVETNINRIKNICEKQMMEGVDGLSDYGNIVLKEATYDRSNYEGLFFDPSMFTRANYKALLAYPIKDAANLQPESGSCMLPCTTSYMKQMSWDGGYDMDSFIETNLGGKWKDKNGNEVTRVKENGYDDFLNDLDTNTYTLTEIPGLDENLAPLTTFNTYPETSLFAQKLYYMQNDDRVKGFMFLCSLGYLYDYEEVFEKYICNSDRTISIIPLPAVIFAGGILWAKEAYAKTPGLFVGCNPNSSTINNCFEDYLSKLDTQIHVKLKKTFTDWIIKGVQNNNIIVSFKEIKNNMELSFLKRSYSDFFSKLGELQDKGVFGGKTDWYKPYSSLLEFFANELGDSFFRNYICVDEDLGGSKDSSKNTVGLRLGNRDGSVGVKQIVDFGLAPCIFTKNTKFFFKDAPKVLSVPVGNLEKFFEGFLDRLKKETPKNNATDNSVAVAKEAQTTTDIKVGVYRYCKLLYDKWIGGMSEDDFKQFKMSSFFTGKDRYFHFIDTYYNLANEKLINIGRFCEMIVSSYQSADYSLLAFLSSIYSDNKFNFICVQNFIDLSKRENMMNMFDCIPYTEHWDVKRHPNFIVMSVYEPSSHLELDGSEYENDGFMINMPDHNGNKWPEALKSRVAGESAGYNIPAFGVSYGKMYQSYFKDISVSMDNPTVTEQSIKAQWAIASINNENSNQGDDAKEYTYGQDLYSIYSNNSYTCEVTMMGDMVTKFKGVRMANVATRTVEECSVSHTMNQTDAGVNSMFNQESAYANVDNDCPYMEYPVSVNGEINVMLTGDEIYNANQLIMAIMSRGYTKEQAAGIVGNIRAESSFKYNVVSCDSNNCWAGGLCQWNDFRLSSLIARDPANAFDNKHGNMPCSSGSKESISKQLPTANEQIMYLLDSLDKDQYLVKNRKVKEYLSKAKTPEDAAYYFAWRYENCSGCSDRTSAKVQERMDFARRYYDNYNDGKFVPPVVNNGDGKVSDFAVGFLHAVNQTSKSSSVNVEVGINKNKSSGDTIYLTNAHNSPDFGKIFDIMLSTYSKKIEEITWIVPGNGENQSLPPEGYIVKLRDNSSTTKVKVINGSNGEQVPAISVDEGGISDDFKRAIIKRYKDNVDILRPRLVMRDITPKMTEDDAKKLFNSSKIKPCNEVMEGVPSNTPTRIEGPFTSSQWDVNAFVKNLHYWQQNICESKGKKRISSPTYNGCGLCTGAINRALKSTGCGDKYWATYPWEVCSKMQKSDSDFVELTAKTETNKQEFTFGVNLLPGDVCTMWSTPNKKLHFHTCAFDGSKWISDFVQNTCNVYRSHNPCTMEYHIFRHK